MSDYGRHIKEVAIALLGEPGERRNDEWRWGTHGSLAVQTDKGSWYDHEQEHGGGVLDLIMRETGRATVRSAISWLEEQGYEQPSKPEKPKQRPRMTATYDYVDENGELRYQVVRMEPKTFRQRRPDGNGWSWSVKGVEPLPYRLPDMLAKPTATVLIAEGEKDADRLADLGFVATCNSGGAGKWHPALSPWFKGRRVVILPDNDEAGRNHADVVGAALSELVESVRVVYLPGLPEKGDPCDWIEAGGTKEALVALCKSAEPWEPAVPDEPEPAPAVETEAADDEGQPGQPFLALGYNGGRYYYLPRGTEQVATIKAGSHTSPAEMMSLAPIEWWEMAYPKEKGGPDWYAAASDCMRRCERRGVYSMRNVRGRGAWYDKGSSVLHLGNRLIVDGEAKQIIEHRSQYIYTRQAPMESIIDAEPATDAEAKEVFDLFGKLNWQKDVHGWLTAGWCALAPVCGAMPWRSHLWITAQRGAGKSWLQENLIQPLLGQSALMVQGGTTEAGIRQSLQQDARPVLFDEAESEDHSAQRRMKSVLELARQASSDGSAEIAKGTVDGNGMAFRIRSMFLLGSVNVSLSQGADESRFSVVSLNRPDKSPAEVQRFNDFARHVGNTLTGERCAAIRARTYKLIPIIRQNAQVMAQAVAEELGSQRIGDQVGTLLAGAISLSRSDAITLDEAREWAKHLDLSDAQESEEVSDEHNCLNAILQTQVRFDYQRGSLQRSLSEVVMAAAGRKALTDDIYADECNQILSRYGLQIDFESLVISNTHAELKRILRDTPWAAGWKRVLARIPGAYVKSSPVRFAGTQTRAVSIPLDAFV